MTEAPTTPVAPPEMDLTIPRDKWPEIIRATSGHLLAYGWPGTGKSHDFRTYASEYVQTKAAKLDIALDYEEVSCTRQTSAAGWVGHWIDTKEGFAWQDGPLARAMKNGVPIVINDVHLCSEDLFDLLFFALDAGIGATMSLNSGEKLFARSGYRALISMNGDPRQVLDEPVLDRIVAAYEINMPSEGALRALDKDVRPLCRAIYKAATGATPPRYTYRTYQAFCQLRRETGDAFIAARLACENEERARGFLEPLLVKGE